jgi:hypothetical protein
MGTDGAITFTYIPHGGGGGVGVGGSMLWCVTACAPTVLMSKKTSLNYIYENVESVLKTDSKISRLSPLCDSGHPIYPTCWLIYWSTWQHVYVTNHPIPSYGRYVYVNWYEHEQPSKPRGEDKSSEQPNPLP